MKRNSAVQIVHPADKDLVRFVEGKSTTVEHHVKSCATCARKVKLIAKDEQNMQQVKLDIKIGAVLERHAPIFQRLARMRVLAESALKPRRRSASASATATARP